MNLKWHQVTMEIIHILEVVLITDNTGFNVITIDDANTSTTFPSIPAVTLKIPLPFFSSQVKVD